MTGCVGLTKTDVLQITMLVRNQQGVTGPSGADMVDSVHILCVCGGGGLVCLPAYVHTHNA